MKSKKKRAEKLMAKGPIKNVRRIIKLEEKLASAITRIEELEEENSMLQRYGPIDD